MRQILQNLSTGETLLAEVPAPALPAGHVLIRTRSSLVSLGTERMLIDFARSGWIEKVRRQPEKVQQVLAKIKTDGLASTFQAVRSKLEQPLPLGYSNVGTVIESTCEEFLPGGRVVSNGPHAEIVVASKNLCAKVPDEVSDEEACFTIIGSIALQGIRLMAPSLGERFVVTGLGLIGLLTVQLLRANGCHVLGVDVDAQKCALARQFGAETVTLSEGGDPIAAAQAFSLGRGVDGVLITASTKSNEPVHQAAVMCRKRGRIVLVGVVGLELARADFYEKELSFQVSCSYGPGRYDDNYERQGLDYPIGFVRWTEQRNFEAFLQLLAERRLNLKPLLSHRFSIENALQAYAGETMASALGILLSYPVTEKQKTQAEPRTIRLAPDRALVRPPVDTHASAVKIGLIGAGNFTGQVLLPALARTGASLHTIASASGVTASHLGRKFGFSRATTDATSVINNPEITAVLITTRHSSHARYVIEALSRGKHVFVEKPLCVNREELEAISATLKDALAENLTSSLMVGFNRRFAPQVQTAKRLLKAVSEPKSMIMTVNAGFIPASHWTQLAGEGGRIIGEACHYIDLLRFLAGSPIKKTTANQLATRASETPKDTATISLEFLDGSIGTIHYYANGNKAFPKERLDVFCAGRVLHLDNFRVLTGYGWKGFSRAKLWKQDKGHTSEMRTYIDSIAKEGISPIPLSEIVEVAKASFDAAGLPA